MSVTYLINGRKHTLERRPVSTESMLAQMARERRHMTRYFQLLVSSGAAHVAQDEGVLQPQGRPSNG